MTLKEKVQKEDPECVDQKAEGGVMGCPGDYGYLDMPQDFTNCRKDMMCEDCWERMWQQDLSDGFKKVT